MTKLKTGLVGCGKVGHLHAKALLCTQDSAFTAVCDREADRTEKFAATYKVKPYTDVEEMIRRENIQLLCICTPHPLHAELAVKAAKRGVHVLVEKPLASSLADCDAILRAAKASGVTIGMVSQRRFYTPCARVKQAIVDGKIGKPILGTVVMYGWRDEAYYRSDPWRGSWKGEGGGVLVNQAPHQIDLLQWYMGEVDELFGAWANLNHPYIEVEDTAIAVLRFKNGALGNILVSNSQNPALHAKVHVHGSNGASIGVQTDGGAMFIAGMTNIIEPPVTDLWTIPGEESLLPQWQKEESDYFLSINAIEHYHQLQVADFVQAVITGRAPAVPAEEGRRTVEIFEALYRSEREKKPIKFPVAN